MTKRQLEFVETVTKSDSIQTSRVADASGMFERAVKQDWVLEGETTVGGETHQVYIKSTPFRVGRRSSNTLTISNRTVSSHHAELVIKHDELLLRDHKSTNGTFLNGQRVNSIVPVEDGDVIHFGKARFHVRRNRDSSTRATMAFDAEGDAMAHLQFASLWDDGALTPHFQPIVDFANERIVGFETLARSGLPGLENPYAMFQIAKEHKAEAELSEQLRMVSMKLAEPINDDGIEIFLNTHPEEIGGKELFDSLEELRTKYPNAGIVMEVHESGAVSISYLEELKRKLTELDMKLAYDDFGRGQSRLNALAEVTPDIVKFDMELVRDLHKATKKRRRFVRSLLRIVKALDGLTLAEGVEHRAEAQVCRELGFDLAQGYFYGRPAPVQKWIHSKEICGDTHKLFGSSR